LKQIVLVLDAMGVLYKSADDVAELLVPFVTGNGGVSDPGTIRREYEEAGLGRISAAAFWRKVGVSLALEDEYLARHQLAEDLPAFLRNLPEVVGSLWCLSNDVAEWSQKLRARHGLTERFSGFVISGDVGTRKPGPEIYQSLLARVGRSAAECIFVDDSCTNLDAARALGFQTILFARAVREGISEHRIVQSFCDLAGLLNDYSPGPDRYEDPA